MRPKYRPSQIQLRKAWRLKKKGKIVKEICKALKISFSQYELNRSVFNSYFVQKKKEEKWDLDSKRTGLGLKRSTKRSANYKKGEFKLSASDIDLDQLKSYVICGFTREKIAELLGVTRNSLHNICKRSPKIAKILTTSKEDAAADLLGNNLMRIAKVHSLPDTHFASHQGDIYSREYTKYFNPNLGAIKYIMANTIGWQSESKPIAPNNKGSILRMMDDIANHEDGVGPVEETTPQPKEK